MERKKLFLSVLPLAFLAESLAGCVPAFNMADYLEMQCKSHPDIEIASEQLKLLSGQQISIGSLDFTVTERGRLRANSYSRLLETDEEGIIVGKDGRFIWDPGKRYRIITRVLDGKTEITVSTNCRDPFTQP
jgi:hypothetical protein